jgi:hypothetical protein
MILAVAIASAAGCVAQDDQTASVEQHSSGLFSCSNKESISVVQCVSIPINIDVKDVDVLSGNDLTVLSNDLNHLNIGDINILNYNTILNGVEATVLNDFLNKFNVDTDVSKIDVCALVLGFCK